MKQSKGKTSEQQLSSATADLRHLGSKTAYQYSNPDASILETFPNPHPERAYSIKFETTEFTSLCPKTGQPDFATILIDYWAAEQCIESKSLKLYLFAYRNVGSFMEAIVNKIVTDLVAACSPNSLRVVGAFNARGGIDTTVEVEYRKPKCHAE